VQLQVEQGEQSEELLLVVLPVVLVQFQVV
jgi:hypothetical protein